MTCSACTLPPYAAGVVSQAFCQHLWLFRCEPRLLVPALIRGQERTSKLTSLTSRAEFGHASRLAARHLLRQTAHAGVATCVLHRASTPPFYAGLGEGLPSQRSGTPTKRPVSQPDQRVALPLACTPFASSFSNSLGSSGLGNEAEVPGWNRFAEASACIWSLKSSQIGKGALPAPGKLPRHSSHHHTCHGQLEHLKFQHRVLLSGSWGKTGRQATLRSRTRSPSRPSTAGMLVRG